MRVAAVQLGLHPKSPDRALAEAEKQVTAAVNKGARLVCLPEHWLLNKMLERHDPILQSFGEMAERSGVYLNLGANFQKRTGKVYLSSHTVGPDGDVLSVQDKLHLYRRERKTASPGRHLGVFDVDGFRVGVLVCHDLVFPEPARTLTLMGAEMIIVPALIEAEGASPWSVYLRARALENRVPIVSPNAYAPPRFPGRSTIVALEYDDKSRIMHLAGKSAPRGPGFVLGDLDLKATRSAREERLGELKQSRSVESLYQAARTARP